VKFLPLTSIATSAATPTKLIRLTNGEWNPYTGTALPGYGCDSKVVSEVFTKVGYSVEYGFFPWARAYSLAETGEWDGTVEWDDTPNHQKDFYISSEPLSAQQWVFYYRKDRSFTWNSLDDLIGKIVGITSGYAYSNAFNDLIKSGKVTFEEASSDEANFNKLLAGRIDVFPIEKNVGHSILLKSFTPDQQASLAFHPKAFHDFHPYLLLSKKIKSNSALIKSFDVELKKLKNSPEYTDIMKACNP
jgi:polar amino acid transport system substrate-binding protein